jgi:hypothetical protein
MPYAMTPTGYRAVLLGSATTIDGLSAFSPLEEGVPEGALMLARLDFEEYPSIEMVNQLNDACLARGVSPWPGCTHVAFLDPNVPSIHIAWQKGIAWLAIIAGILTLTVLPPLLMAFVWWILPESITSMIEALFMIGIMFLLFYVMMQFMKPLTAPQESKEIEEGRG